MLSDTAPVTPAAFSWDCAAPAGKRGTYVARGLIGLGLDLVDARNGTPEDSDSRPARSRPRPAPVAVVPEVPPAPLVADWPEPVDYDSRVMLGLPVTPPPAPEPAISPIVSEIASQVTAGMPVSVDLPEPVAATATDIAVAAEPAGSIEVTPDGAIAVSDITPPAAAETAEVSAAPRSRHARAGKRGQRLPPPRPEALRAAQAAKGK